MLTLLAACLLQAPPATPAPAPPKADGPRVAAIVNGEPVFASELDALVKSTLADLGPATPRQAAQLRRELLRDLIGDKLLAQYLRQHGPKIEPAQLDDLARGLVAALERQGQTLPEYLKQTRQTEAQLRASWTAMLQFAALTHAQATDAEVRAYYERNAADFDASEVEVRHIVLRLSPDAAPAERAQAQAKLAAVRAEIAAGKLSFADAARKYSLCASASRGGSLGWVARHDPRAEPAVVTAAFGLPDGALSGPIDSDIGVHLVQATGKKLAPARPYAEVAELARERFLAELQRQWVERLREKAAIEVRE